MFKTGAGVIVEGLEKEGVKFVFGIPGIETLKLFDAFRESGIKSILVTHEQSASFMANAYNKVTGEVGVCCSIGGPGITNMFTGLAEAYLDSSAVVALVSSTRSDTSKSFHLHQINQIQAVRPIVKDVFSVEKKEDLLNAVSQAFDLAKNGEPGPVIVDVPANILQESIIFTKYYERKIQEDSSEEKIKEIADLLAASKYLCIYAGLGALDASDEIRELAERFSAPIATTISARGIIPEDHPLVVGCGFGFGNSKLAYDILEKSDTILAVGCKFSELSTGGWSLKIPENLVHIDKNKDIFNKNYPAKIALVSDVKVAIKKILFVIKAVNSKKNLKLIKEIKETKERYSRDIDRRRLKESISPQKFFYELRKLLDRDSILVTDCGNHQLYAISNFPIFKERTFISPTDFQAMGFGIPAAIAAKIACPKKKVVCVCGDGGFLMTGFELLTAVRERLDLTVMIFNDSALGLIKELQKAIYGRTSSVDFINPNYKLLTDSFGAKYIEINDNQQLSNKLKSALLENGVVIVDCKINYKGLPSYIKNILWESFKIFSLKEKLLLISRIIYQHAITKKL
jgi:acetolactate synthase I/II/III large subunit